MKKGGWLTYTNSLGERNMGGHFCIYSKRNGRVWPGCQTRT